MPPLMKFVMIVVIALIAISQLGNAVLRTHETRATQVEPPVEEIVERGTENTLTPQ